MITITAFIRVKKNRADLEKVDTLFTQLIDETRNEVGCLKYDLHEVIDQPGLFIIMEEWASEGALDDHNTSRHFTNFVTSAEPYFVAPIEEFMSSKLI